MWTASTTTVYELSLSHESTTDLRGSIQYKVAEYRPKKKTAVYLCYCASDIARHGWTEKNDTFSALLNYIPQFFFVLNEKFFSLKSLYKQIFAAVPLQLHFVLEQTGAGWPCVAWACQLGLPFGQPKLVWAIYVDLIQRSKLSSGLHVDKNNPVTSTSQTNMGKLTGGHR